MLTSVITRQSGVLKWLCGPADRRAPLIEPGSDGTWPDVLRRPWRSWSMRDARRAVVDASIGLLFFKGLLLVPVTLYTFARAYLAREPTPAVGVASCAAGTFAFAMACFGVWVRKRLD